MKHTDLLILSVSLLCGSAVMAFSQSPLTLQVGENGPHRVEATVDGRVYFQSPSEGLWSVATAWSNGWPAHWVHASPAKVEKDGPWTLVSGKMELPGGTLVLRDAYRAEGALVKGIRRFTWDSKQTLSNCTLAVRWIVPGAVQAKPLFPGVLYYGNPNGAQTDKNAVIVHAGVPGDESFCEEHRFSSPWASLEWQDTGWHSVALHTLPSLVTDGHLRDQWWSMGARALADASELALLSGPCAANGRHSVIKALQSKVLDYPDAWVDLHPGAVVEKTFYLEACPVTEQGGGFRQPLRTAIKLHPLGSIDDFPSYHQIIHDKYRFALTRFRDREKDPGFEMFPDYIPGTQYVMGWCGQADAAGYAMLGLAKVVGDSRMISYGTRSLNLLASTPFNEHGFQLKYTAENGQWSDQDPVSQGQAMEGFARAIAAARQMPGIDSKPWEEFLKKACALHAARILRSNWQPRSTAEGFFISPLCKGYTLFGNEDFKRAAIKAGEHYAQRHLTMAEPYWGGTLDAQCEDKEGAWAGFQGFTALYELTREQRYLDWAAHALDVTLTYTVLWDIDLPPGRMRDHDFKTRGWTIVSAQNQHLDVFGVMFTPEIWRMGDYLGRPELKRIAAIMYRSCGQMIDPSGSQGEQLQHTNFAQSGDMSAISRLRGGYSEHWTVFWITAHFLNAAAEFERLGIDLDKAEQLLKL
jgi:hypothetical protein